MTRGGAARPGRVDRGCEISACGGTIEDEGGDMRVDAMMEERRGCTTRGGVREGDTEAQNNNQHRKRAT